MTRFFQDTPYAAAVTSGLLTGFAFPPYHLGILAWFGLVPLLLRLATAVSWRQVVAESITASTLCAVVVGYWTFFHPIASARTASILGLTIVAISVSIPFWFFGIRIRRTSLPLRFGWLFLVSAAVDFGHFHAAIGFPLLVTGHTQAMLFPLNQLAAFVGAPGLSLWVLVSNALLTGSVLAKQRLRWLTASAYMLFLGVTLAIGFAQSRVEQPVAAYHRIAAVQPAASPQTWAKVRDRGRQEDLIALTRSRSTEGLDLIIWPETSLLLDLNDAPSDDFLKLTAFIDSLNTPLLTGAVLRSGYDQAEGEPYHNSAVVVTPLEGITDRYDKRIPVPFAEWVPYVDAYPWLERLAVASGGVPGYAPGSEPGRIRYGKVPIGVMICFESAFGRAARDAGPDSVAYFVVLAQDGWWDNTNGYRHHFDVGRLRAIETGRAVVQVTVTGITGLILPDGSSSDETGWMDRTVRHMTVPAFTGTTPYARFGDLPALLLSLCLFCTGFVLHVIVTNKVKTVP